MAMELCARCGRRSRSDLCGPCRADLRTEDAEWRAAHAGHEWLELTFDDLRPDVARALRQLADLEGATIGDRLRLDVQLEWQRELFDHGAWEGRFRRGEAGSSKRNALEIRFGFFWKRWLDQGRPRPELTAAWQDDELAMMALSGQSVPTSRWRWSGGLNLRRPYRRPGSSIRACQVCGEPFEGKRADARTCSPRCRKRLSRA